MPVDMAMVALLPLEDALGGGSVDVVSGRRSERSLDQEWPVRFTDAMIALRIAGRSSAADE